MNLKYTTKIWLTAVMVSPVLMLISFFALSSFLLTHNCDNASLLKTLRPIPGIYFMLVCIELISSLITWLVFTLAVIQITLREWSLSEKKWCIFGVGILLVFATFAGFFALLGILPLMIDSMGVIAVGCNCICIAAGVSFYKLEPITINN